MLTLFSCVLLYTFCIDNEWIIFVANQNFSYIERAKNSVIRTPQ